MAVGPWFVWVAGFVGLFGLVGAVELGVLVLRFGARVASGDDS